MSKITSRFLGAFISRFFQENTEILKMLDQNTRKRPKSPSISLIELSAPWVLISVAAQQSGLTELLIRKSNVTLRKFGNADYVRPTDLNAWIVDGGKEGSAL